MSVRSRAKRDRAVFNVESKKVGGSVRRSLLFGKVVPLVAATQRPCEAK